MIISLFLITLSLEKVWISLGENWCLSLLGLGFFFVQEMKQESYSVCVGGRGLGGERKVFSLPWISVSFSDSGTWFLMPGRLDSSGHPCCLLNSFIYLNFMYFTIVTSKWTELIANLPQEPQAIKPSKFSEYFVFMSQRLSTLVQNDEINIFEIFATLIVQDWILLLLLGFALLGEIITTIFKSMMTNIS